MPEILSLLAAPAENGAVLMGSALVCPAENGATLYSLGGTYTPPSAPPGGTTTAPSTNPTFTIAARSSYPVAHTLSVLDMRDGLELPVDAVSMSNDVDALFWTLRASGKAALFTRMQAGVQPPSVRVTLNGQVWEFVVDSVTRSRAFPEAGVQLTGRSVTAAAGAPYEFEQAWTVDGDTTAAQIAAAANLVTGLEVVWGIADWPVPDRVFSHFGTPLSVVKRVADAAGALVQSDRAGYTVRVLPRYPLLPNEWPVVAPDVEIALAALVTESFERADRPEYDGVYCMGQQQGAFAFVSLAGTSGAQQHPLVTDLLLTDDVACGLRGQAILGASGEQQTHTITLPVLSGSGEPGVLDVGMLARIVEPGVTWYGIVRGVDVQAAMPEANQTVRLERHTRLIGGTVATPPATATPLLFTGPIADQVVAPGAAFSLSLATYWSLGVLPYAWSMRSGTLPAWVSLNAATGLLSGTAPGSPAAAVPLAFRATDDISSTADSNELQLSVVAAGGTTWTLRTTPGSRDWYSITWNGAVFVAVGANFSGDGAAMTSPDGATWTLRTVPVGGSARGVAWNGTVFVAVGPTFGGSNGAMTSPDGITWTLRTTPTAIDWDAVAWNGSVFVAVGPSSGGNGAMTSPDGITWTQRTVPSSGLWRSVAWNGSLFVAVRYSGGGSNAMTSPDGVTWTLRTTPTTVAWRSVAWNGSVFVAVGLALSGGGAVMTSPDGTTWTLRTSPTSPEWFGVAWNGSLFAAVSTDSGSGAMTSPNGITWTLRTTPSANWSCVTAGVSQFVAAKLNDFGSGVMTS